MLEKLRNIATFVNGYQFRPSDWADNGLPIIRIQNLTGNSYKVNRYSGRCPQKYEVNNGDVLISWATSLGVYIWTGEKALLNHHIYKVVFDKVEVNKRFFVYQMQKILEEAEAEARGSKSKCLSRLAFEALPFYLPSMETQEEIANVLDKVSDLIFKLKEQIQMLNRLVDLRFIEMFANEQTEDMLGNLCRFIDYRGKTPPKEDHGLFLITAKNVKMHQMSFASKEYVSPDTYDSIMTRGIPKEGDVLFTTEGPVGNVCRIPKMSNKFCVGQRILTIQTDILEPIYLEYAISTDSFRKKAFERTTGVNEAGIGSRELKRLSIPVPERSRQKQFADFVEKSEKSKQILQQKLKKMEELKDSLMTEYFG